MRHAFELAHLADDCSIVRKAPGAAGLFRAIRRNKAHFANFRYELRIAGALGRAPAQRLVALGGPNPGPDIEFDSDSGHRCGVACYRASSETELAGRHRALAAEIARDVLTDFHLSPIEESFGIHVTFDEGLPAPEHVEGGKGLLRILLRDRLGAPERAASGVRAQRIPIPERLLLPGDLRRVRLRLAFPVREAEQERVLRHLRQKALREHESWIGAYDGVALLAVEESDGVQHGALQGGIAQLLAEHVKLDGAFLTLGGYRGIDDDSPRIERVGWIAGTERTHKLHIEFKTFFQNVDTWAAGRPVVSFASSHAREDWDLFTTVAGSGVELVDSLSAPTHLVRMSHVPTGVRPTDHPPFRAELGRAIEELNRRTNAYRRAPTLLTPLHSRRSGR